MRIARIDPQHSIFQVTFNGEDVSDTCVRADDLEGWVILQNGGAKQYGAVIISQTITTCRHCGGIDEFRSSSNQNQRTADLGTDALDCMPEIS